MTDLGTILTRLQDLLRNDASLAFAAVDVVDGLENGPWPKVAVFCSETPYAQTGTVGGAFDTVQTTVSVAFSLQSSDGVEGERRLWAKALQVKQWLNAHRLLGSGTEGSALLDGSRVLVTRYQTANIGTTDWLHAAQIDWQIDYREPRYADPLVPYGTVKQRIFTYAPRTVGAGPTEIKRDPNPP